MPPTTSATVCCELERMTRKALSTCMASSRVGSRISACAAFMSLVFCSISTIGIRNPSVLPVPVCAVASTSRPSRAGGMQPICTGVGITKLLASMRAIRAGERENCENSVVKAVKLVKIDTFLLWFREPHFPQKPAIGTGPGGWHTNPVRVPTCYQNMRKGEPKILRTDWPASKNARSPELPHATCLPVGSLPAGSTAPTLSRSSCAQLAWRQIQCRDIRSVQGRVTGQETQVDTL